jgi:hypothetical protein
MAEGPVHDLAAANPPADEDTRSDSEAESTTMQLHLLQLMAHP